MVKITKKLERYVMNEQKADDMKAILEYVSILPAMDKRLTRVEADLATVKDDVASLKVGHMTMQDGMMTMQDGMMTMQDGIKELKQGQEKLMTEVEVIKTGQKGFQERLNKVEIKLDQHIEHHSAKTA